MRISLSVVTFIFLGVAAAGVIPDIAGRNPGTGQSGGKGGHSASVSGVHSHPSGSPTGASLHTIPTSIQSHSPAARRDDTNTSAVHSIYPTSHSVDPSASHSHHSGSPTGASGHPAPSVSGHSHSQASRRAEPTGGHSHHPSGASASVHPTGSAGSHSHSINPSGITRSHKSSSPTDSIKPTATTA